METVKYKKEQIEKIFNLLNEVKTNGQASVTALAMVYQELNQFEKE